jgi:hypothetical protein
MNDKSCIEIFSTTPQSTDFLRKTYVQQVIDVANPSNNCCRVPAKYFTGEFY